MKCSKCNLDNPDTLKFCGECGTKLDLSEDVQASPTKTLETPKEELTTGSTFAGRYQLIEEELGRGGMGFVHRDIKNANIMVAGSGQAKGAHLGSAAEKAKKEILIRGIECLLGYDLGGRYES